jgi:hypothetical protein
MTTKGRTLPTLTEVIATVPVDQTAASLPLPLAPESLPLDRTPTPPAPLPEASLQRLPLAGADASAELVDAVLRQLQPRLEVWVREQMADVLQESLESAVRDLVRREVDRAASEVARRLRDELPTLARDAVAAVRADGFES